MKFLGTSPNDVFLSGISRGECDFFCGVSGEGNIFEDIYAMKVSASLVAPIITSTSLRSKLQHYWPADSWPGLLRCFSDSFVMNNQSCQALPSKRAFGSRRKLFP